MQGHILIVEDEEAIAAFVQTALAAPRDVTSLLGPGLMPYRCTGCTPFIPSGLAKQSGPLRRRLHPIRRPTRRCGPSRYLTKQPTSSILLFAPKWRNWQTRTTQNRVGYALVGSIPTFGIR